MDLWRLNVNFPMFTIHRRLLYVQLLFQTQGFGRFSLRISWSVLSHWVMKFLLVLTQNAWRGLKNGPAGAHLLTTANIRRVDAIYQTWLLINDSPAGSSSCGTNQRLILRAYSIYQAVFYSHQNVYLLDVWYAIQLRSFYQIIQKPIVDI